MQEWELALRGAAAMQLLFNAALLARARNPGLPHWLTIAFAFGVVAYLACSIEPGPARESWRIWVAPFCIANPFTFWLLGQAIFVDGFRLRPWHVLPLLFLEGLIFGASRTPWPSLMHLAQQALSLGLVLWVLALALLGRAGDLVEARRRLRLWLIFGTGLLVAVVIAVEIGLAQAPAPAPLRLGAVALILALALSFGLALAAPEGSQLLDLARPTPKDAALSARERALLERLNQAMAEERLYREEGLTIAALAERLGSQEHVLRRLINAAMGHRNFAEFLHGYRLAEAEARLADPAAARIPILTIALEAGYGSIGPFNRAFKERTGLTPSAYRRQRLQGKSADA